MISPFDKLRVTIARLENNHKEDTVTILDGQASSMIYSFTLANALVYLPEGSGHLAVGTKVETLMLPI